MDSNTTILEKVPPQAMEAEQSALGAMLIDRDAIDRASGLLRADDFYREAHRDIFTAICECRRLHGNADIISVIEWLKGRGKLESVGGQLYLTTLMSQVPSAAGIGRYARIILDRAAQRKGIKRADELQHALYTSTEDIDALLSAAAADLDALASPSATASRRRSIGDIAKTVYYRWESALDGNVAPGYRTGYPRLDASLDWIAPGSLTIVAARPSMGKTALAMNIARNIANTGVPSMLFSFEMASEGITMREMLAHMSMESADVFNAEGKAETLRLASEAVDHLLPVNLEIDDDPTHTLRTMVREVKAWRREQTAKGYQGGAVFVDYAQLIPPDTGDRRASENRVQELSKLTRGLKMQLARDCGVAVFALSQLSRECEKRSPKRPMLSDLRESGSLEQDADLVLFVYRPSYYGDAEMVNVGLDAETMRGYTEIIIGKQRSGQAGRIIHLAFDGAHGCRFRDLTAWESEALKAHQAQMRGGQ